MHAEYVEATRQAEEDLQREHAENENLRLGTVCVVERTVTASSSL